MISYAEELSTMTVPELIATSAQTVRDMQRSKIKLRPSFLAVGESKLTLTKDQALFLFDSGEVEVTRGDGCTILTLAMKGCE